MSVDDSPTSVAVRVAAELKSAAADLSDEDGAARRNRFAELLLAAEKKLAPQQHPEFYQALARWFPSSTAATDSAGASSSSTNGSAGATAAISASNSAPPRTPDGILSAIRSVLPTLSGKDKQTFLLKLGELVPRTSIGPASPSASSAAAAGGIPLAAETIRMLGVPADAKVDPNRLAPLVGLLIEVLVLLDAAAWDVWDSLGAESKGLKREVVMKKAIAMLLTGQSKLTVGQLQLQIAQLQRLTVELLAQMNKVGDYASKHLSKVSPKSLTQAAEAEPRGWSLVSLPARCWERYSEKFDELQQTTQASVNKQVALDVSGAVNAQRF